MYSVTHEGVTVTHRPLHTDHYFFQLHGVNDQPCSHTWRKVWMIDTYRHPGGSLGYYEYSPARPVGKGKAYRTFIETIIPYRVPYLSRILFRYVSVTHTVHRYCCIICPYCFTHRICMFFAFPLFLAASEWFPPFFFRIFIFSCRFCMVFSFLFCFVCLAAFHSGAWRHPVHGNPFRSGAPSGRRRRGGWCRRPRALQIRSRPEASSDEMI